MGTHVQSTPNGTEACYVYDIVPGYR